MALSKLALVADGLHWFRLWDAVLRARASRFWPWPGLLVVLYHRVARADGLGGLDPELVDATPEEFREHLRLFRRYLHPVRLAEVLAATRGGPPLPPNAVLVTFDDGYRDNYRNALPILLEQGIVATFFVSTGYLHDHRLFWWERISLLVRGTSHPKIELRYPTPASFPLGTPGDRRAAIHRLTRTVKDCYGLDLERFLAELATACQVEEASAIERRHAEAALMTWEDVVALDRAGMDVGSHTCSHRVLQTLPPEEIGHELRQSRQDLEARLNKPVLAIAYPVGHSIAQVPFIREAVRSAGYELGFTTTPGWNRRAPAGDQLDLKRISIDHGTSAARTRASLAFPRFAR